MDVFCEEGRDLSVQCDDGYTDDVNESADAMLAQQSWYHGEIDRKEAIGRLKVVINFPYSPFPFPLHPSTQNTTNIIVNTIPHISTSTTHRPMPGVCISCAP